MTATFAFAAGNLALVAADTRLNLHFRDGRSGNQDDGPIDFTYLDGRVLRVTDHYRKIRPVGVDWACGAGFFPLIDAALTELTKPAFRWSQVDSVLATVGSREIPRCQDDFGASRADVERTAILYTLTRGAMPTLGGYKFDGSNPVPGGSQYVLQTPPELSPSDHAQIMRQLRGALSVPSNMSELFGLLRAVAAVFHRVSTTSSTVSDRMEVGMTIHAQGPIRRRLCTSCQSVKRASDGAMEQLFVDA
jgi:hypothetical protein